MEHRLKQDEEIEELLGIEPEEIDFEQYLAGKAKDDKWQDSVSELTELEILDGVTLDQKLAARKQKPSQSGQKELLEKYPGLDAQNAVAPSSPDLNSPVDADSLPRMSHAAQGADEKHGELVLHTHPLVGTYVTEEVKSFSVDEEWQKVFVETYKISIVECTPEQVITRIHDLDRAIYLMRAQQNGLRLSLEELLQATTAADRERLLEMDRKFKVKQARKATGKSPEKAKASSGPRSKHAKMIDTLKSLEMSKGAIEAKLKGANLLDEQAQAYIDKSFS